jgi:hypothetical protein
VVARGAARYGTVRVSDGYSREHRQLRRFTLPVALVAVLAATYAATVAAGTGVRSDAAEDQFVVGTIRFPPGERGTSFAFHVPASKPDILTYGLAVRFILHGPKGWNKGHALATKCFQVAPESLDTCDSWVRARPIAGDYTATGAHGATWTATIDLTPVTPPQSVSARPTSAGASVSWRRGTETGAYYIEVYDAHTRIREALVPGGARKHVFAGLKLKPGAEYWFYVTAYPTNITKDIKLATAWSVSTSGYYLRAP